MKYIIAYGNELRSDDGVGHHILSRLSRLSRIKEKQQEKQQEKQPNLPFCLLDFANNAWGILSLLNSNSEKILIIDCAYMGKNPGYYQFFSLAEVSQQLTTISEAHGNSLIQLINITRQLDYPLVEITFMGIEPYSLAIGQQLSLVVESNIDKYTQAVIKHLSAIS